jgi:hypothetical protein
MEENINMSSLGGQQKADYVILTDIVDLPSKGAFYKNKKSQVEVEMMTAKDEAILLSPNLVKKGEAFNKLISLKVKGLDGITPKDLLVCDKNAILMFLRASAYGPLYETSIISPFNNEEFTVSVNITTLKEKELNIYPDVNGHFNYLIGGKKIVFRLLTSGELENVVTIVDNKMKQNGGINYILTEKLVHQIVSIDGDTELINIRNYVDRMRPFEAKELRNYINEVEPGLDMSYNFTCPFTGNDFRSEFTILSDFFYPQ